jgi:hypothetical protein
MDRQLMNIRVIARNLAIVNAEMSMQTRTFPCVVCNSQTTLSLARKFNHYTNSVGVQVTVEDLEPRFAVLRWNETATNCEPQFLVCGDDCRKHYLKSLPYELIMGGKLEPAVLPPRLLGAKVEDFRNDTVNNSLNPVRQGWYIVSQSVSTRSKLLSALVYEMRLRDKTVVYLEGSDFSHQMQRTSRSYRIEDYDNFMSSILRNDVIAIEDVDCCNWDSVTMMAFFKKLDRSQKIIIATSPVSDLPGKGQEVSDRLVEICTVVKP